MTVIDSAAGELAVARERAKRKRRLDGVLVLSMIVALQLAWLTAIAYGAYRLAT